jgi:hypothetical protein
MMPMPNPDPNSIFEVRDSIMFNNLALSIFHYQAESCPVYRDYIRHIGVDPADVKTVEHIPFLPISFFKNFRVVSGASEDQQLFRSSRTTGQLPSTHHVTDIALYDRSIDAGFDSFYGDPKGFAILALLPSYLERDDASLVYMAQRLMTRSGHPSNGFFLNDYLRLVDRLDELLSGNQRFILLGVTYALLDLATFSDFNLGSNIVVETGGMKGRRKEMIRQELHRELCERYGVAAIHSEYGMTELLSQAWSSDSGKYHPVPWMRVSASEVNDPFQSVPAGESGILNVIDLANVNSCSFIATEDLGKVYHDGSFEVLGRLDQSEIRGCSLMVV